MIWLWWAPLLVAVLHIIEEFVYPGGFAAWDRDYRPRIRSSITPRLHVFINVFLLLACISVGLAGMTGGGAEVSAVRIHSLVPPQYAVAAWLTLSALLLSNAVFHVLGTVRTGLMSPGVCTGVLLYLPLAVFGYWHFLRAGEVSAGTAVLSVLLGGSYHIWAAMLHSARARGSEVE